MSSGGGVVGHEIFVYGTLRAGGANHELLAGAEPLGPARTVPRFRLVEMGGHPAMLEGGAVSVAGERWRVDAATLARLDELEEHPTWYRRQPVALAGGGTAEAYLLPEDQAAGKPVIVGGDWLAPGPERLATERLELRPLDFDDADWFAAMNADPQVFEFLVGPLDRAASDAALARLVAHRARHGFAPWAACLRDGGAPIGMIGLYVPSFTAPFTPCVEILWRLAAPHWGRGLASEGARAALDFARRVLGLEEVVAMTVPANLRSQAVMQKIGLRRDEGGDFDHPRVPEGHRLKRHILYRG